MFKKVVFITLIFFCFFVEVNAQLLTEEELDTATVYHSLSEANLNPDFVFVLDLSKQKLSEFPKDIFNYKNLNVLILAKNKISKLPDSISSLKYLQIIDVSKNKLTVLPDGFYQLENLKEVNISGNPITVISYKIMQLKELQKFSLWGLPIEKIPEQILQLPKLEYLDVRQINISSAETQAILKKLEGVEIRTTSTCDCGV